MFDLTVEDAPDTIAGRIGQKGTSMKHKCARLTTVPLLALALGLAAWTPTATATGVSPQLTRGGAVAYAEYWAEVDSGRVASGASCSGPYANEWGKTQWVCSVWILNACDEWHVHVDAWGNLTYIRNVGCPA